jgi:hypothetical protein
MVDRAIVVGFGVLLWSAAAVGQTPVTASSGPQSASILWRYDTGG